MIMPYPYYTPSYTPNYYQPNYQQNYQQPVQQPNYQPQSSIIWISGEREAQMYPVAPNGAVTLWSQAEPVVYLKQADATGKPTLKVYDLVERVQKPSNESSASDAKSIEYATKSDLSAVVGVVNGFDELIGSMKGEIETLKTDMYGIAGKKKAKKAKEEDE